MHQAAAAAKAGKAPPWSIECVTQKELLALLLCAAAASLVFIATADARRI